MLTGGPRPSGEVAERLRRAQEELCGDGGESTQSGAFVVVGDPIGVDEEAGFLRGHGTLAVGPRLSATLCGVVERVNKLVSVKPLKARYVAETGDVVIGRVSEVAQKRWKVDVNSRQDAQLMLSAVNLPGGVQRRRTAVDELNMRTLYCEGDLISAEVQSSQHDGSMSLHTRSLKYGKLLRGQLVQVAPYLVKRLRQHFHVLTAFQVDLILGCNGFVFVSAPKPSGQDDMEMVDADAAAEESELLAAQNTSSDIVELEVRERICRVANAIRALAGLGLPIEPDTILSTAILAEEGRVPLSDMLLPEFLALVAELEPQRRLAATKKSAKSRKP